MNAARGTRRPHPRRVYKKTRRASRTKGKGCALLVLAFLALPALILAVTR